MKSHPNQSSIFIIGAGLGGLALAQGLAAAGFDVTILERDSSPVSRAQGYRISMTSLGLAALEALLPPDLFKQLSVARIKNIGTGFTYATYKLRTLFRAPEGKDYVVQMLRSKLREILLTGLKVEWNKQLVSIREIDNKIEIQCEDNSKFIGDLLVGCDGNHSKVREILRKNLSQSPRSVPEVIDSGIVIIGGHVERTSDWNNILPLNRFGPVRFLGLNGHSLFVSFSEREDRSPTIMWAFSQYMDRQNASKQELVNHCI